MTRRPSATTTTRRRSISTPFSPSIVHTQHNGKLINVIDTPGYPDFIGPAIVAIPAAETAILVIGAASGIETNTRKFFHLTSEANKPRVIVINKMDAENVEFPELLSDDPGDVRLPVPLCQPARGGQELRHRLHREQRRQLARDGRGGGPHATDRERDRGRRRPDGALPRRRGNPSRSRSPRCSSRPSRRARSSRSSSPTPATRSASRSCWT